MMKVYATEVSIADACLIYCSQVKELPRDSEVDNTEQGCSIKSQPRSGAASDKHELEFPVVVHQPVANLDTTAGALGLHVPCEQGVQEWLNAVCLLHNQGLTKAHSQLQCGHKPTDTQASM